MLDLGEPAEAERSECLRALGLGSYEARAFLSLINAGSATAPDVANSAKVPRQRIYDVLARLVEAGLVDRLPGHPALYTALDPQAGLEGLIDKHKRALVRLGRRTSELALQLRQAWIFAQPGAGLPREQARSYAGLATREYWREARSAVCAISLPPFEGLGENSWVQEVERITKTGGVVRCIYDRSILQHPALLEQARGYALAGEDCRVADNLPTRMILTDNRLALLPMPSPDKESLTALMMLIEDRGIVDRLEQTFRKLWMHAAPLFAAAK